MDNLEFQNKWFLVTGASSGIGAETAKLLASRGATLLLLARNEEKLKDLKNELEGSEHRVMPFDLMESNGLFNQVKDMLGEKRLSGLFHCAGVELVKPASMVNDKNIHEVLSTSLLPMFALTKIITHKKTSIFEQKSMVVMSSVAALRGQSGMSLYSACKAGIEGMVRSLAIELAPLKTRVNAITSGGVVTEMHNRLTQSMPEAAIVDYQNKHPLGFGEPIDIAEAASFLLSEKAKWITGSNLIVDGGLMSKL